MQDYFVRDYSAGIGIILLVYLTENQASTSPVLFTPPLNLSAAQVGLRCEIPHILTEGESVFFFCGNETVESPSSHVGQRGHFCFQSHLLSTCWLMPYLSLSITV